MEHTTQPDDPVRIYPLIADSGNRRVLGKWLADHETYVAVDDHPITEADIDLCIVDGEGLRRHRDDLESVKNEARPTLLPVLLLLSERDAEIIATDRSEIADNVLMSTVDEVVSLPMRQAELEWRIGALLRLRSQSLELDAKTKKLRQFREAVEASGHAIFITDPDGRLTYVNPAFESVTGYDAEEVIGETPALLNSGEMSETYYEKLWETIEAGETWEAEIVDRRKDGELYTAYQTIAPIADDEVRAFVAVQTDITEHKQLRDRLKRHRDIIQQLEDPIMLQDDEGRFELVNEALCEFAGLSASELAGRDEYLFMDDEAAETIERRKSEALDTGEPVRYSISPEFERSGKEAVFRTSRYPYYNETDELVGTFAICRDVTDLEERTRQLRVLDNILRHNLRNDLTVIRGLADRIRTESSGETAETAERIVSHADDLMTTGEKSRSITELLGEEPEIKRIDIASLARSVAEGIGAERPAALIDVDVPERATAETTFKFREAMEELIKNAIDHSDRETPSIEIRILATGDTVEVRVVDDGPGIPAVERDVLVTGRAIDDLYHGSGLGLWLVYWIVEQSDGSIDVTDAEPRGTEIEIRLPRVEDDDAVE
ncbi:sensor box histidine kinase [Natronomonas moolapensis 8.8.11]|uniref:Sensor box histidine kinase n=1 Tax=Natronomonas moolapensis (strain DSM 18674 / CECT 7526 / JCM 14361 / 8.8.11) TaxID=268739 RepID=M1XR33_NATM8|nr:PAS domain S-box protein [Natronomonas moolapensis]CCQ36659.1 sensor box histidine kinase [Natronomonas moolapensis 8.8.11]